jgi:hypothetical protein
MKNIQVPPPPANKPVRFIACSERTQTFNWQKTSGLGSDVDYATKGGRKTTKLTGSPKRQ